jgi:transposase
MGRKKIKYTHEFRAEAVKLVTEQGYSQAQVSRRLGINPKNLNRWVHAMKGKRGSNGKVVGFSAEQIELQQLGKENKRLKLESEILKKAAAFLPMKRIKVCIYSYATEG